MSWPHCEKSKTLIQLINDCEITAFGIQTEKWSPETNKENLITLRIDKLLNEIGQVEHKSKKLYEKARFIAHHLGISFWDDNEDSDSDSDSPKVES
jgi:hypothetical protein